MYNVNAGSFTQYLLLTPGLYLRHSFTTTYKQNRIFVNDVLYPRYCTGADCSHVVTFVAHEDTIDFEVKSKTDGYVSVGFSNDSMMVRAAWVFVG